MELLSGFGKRGVELNLLTKPAEIQDTEFLSKYFVLQEFGPTLTAGRNSITFNGSDLLQQGSEILVECIDSAGLPLYIESTTKTNIAYKESSAYILAIHVYSEASNGPGKLILYGTTTNGATVKWIGNVAIDKTLNNVSPVRFYSRPALEVDPILTPVLATVGDLNKPTQFSGSFYSFAVTPAKDTLEINKRNVDVDYRIYCRNVTNGTDPTGSFNSQLVGNTIDLNVKTIQQPYSYRNTDVAFTASFKVKEVLNSSTIIIDSVVSYPDSKNNDVVVNVVNGDFFVNYPYIVYNTASESSSYLVANTKAGHVLVKQSYANVVYRNLRTFSGFISRHKLYKKSLFSPGDFVVVADEPLVPYELLQDKLTTNKSFDLMGTFYNQSHVDKYWYANGLTQLTQSAVKMIDSVVLNYTGSNSDLNSLGNYVIVKDNTSGIDRNPNYYAFDPIEFNATSGSSYDSNFIELKKGVNYVISLNAILKKDLTTVQSLDSGLEFYFTSSFPAVELEQNASRNQIGLLSLGFVPAFSSDLEKTYTPYNILFTVSNDLNGTLVIVPKKCTATISNLTLKPYGDYGFSPDTLITRIPFPVTIANEAFEIKAELFDINSNLVFSDLRTIASFDPSGSSLSVFIPGYQNPSNVQFISGSLEISKSLLVDENTVLKGSLTVQGTVEIQNIQESTYTLERMLGWNPSTNQVVYTNVNDINPVGTEEIDLTLYQKGGNNKLSIFRLIPSIPGRNISVPKKPAGALTQPNPPVLF